MTESLTARVQAGIELLDANAPGWRDKVNPATLDMQSSWRCVLGQVYGSLGEGSSLLGEAIGRFELPTYGFNTSGESFEDLTDEWRRQIAVVPA